jgi:neutral ceramidase
MPIAAFCVFASHGTCVHADNFLVHPDHKGIAAARLEEEWRQKQAPEFVALFAQGSAGDVTPNFRPSATRGFHITAWDDDYEGAEQVAAAQVASARRAMRLDAPGLLPNVARAWTRVNYAAAPVSPEHANGVQGRCTGEGVLGLAMMMGTAEGPGPFRAIRSALQAATALSLRLAQAVNPRGVGSAYIAVQGPKLRGLDMAPLGQGKAVGSIPVPWFRHVPHVDGFARGIRRVLYEATDADPWLNPELPLQILRLGSLALVALPFEPTTQAGRRLTAVVQRGLVAQGVTHTVAVGYSNDYGGYLTTPEEYACQEYEGGFTLFGRWQLDATRSALAGLCGVLKDASAA